MTVIIVYTKDKKRDQYLYGLSIKNTTSRTCNYCQYDLFGPLEYFETKLNNFVMGTLVYTLIQEENTEEVKKT